jgi:hypothetical protein
MSASRSTLSLSASEALYLYTVTRADHEAVDGPGIDDRPLHRVRHDPFVATVSVVDRVDWVGEQSEEHMQSLSWVGPRAYRHEQVVEAVMAEAGPVFPARFGTLYSGPEGLKEALDTHRDPLVSFFESIEGAEEWAVKGLLDRETAKAHLAGEAPAEAESGTAYLQRRKQVQDAEAELDDWLDDTAEALLEPLDELVAETRVLPVRGNAGREAEVAFNWAFLVPRSQVDAFRAEVERREQEYEAYGLTLDLTGPWPPYNFRPSLQDETGPS